MTIFIVILVENRKGGLGVEQRMVKSTIIIICKLGEKMDKLVKCKCGETARAMYYRTYENKKNNWKKAENYYYCSNCKKIMMIELKEVIIK
jgi:hypothetical protein